MGERGMQIKSDQNNTGWEEAEFPIACETCLGDNPYVRMTKEPHGKACKICERPYCVFRWRPGTNARYKSTQVSSVLQMQCSADKLMPTAHGIIADALLALDKA
jgi:hypothetical protein